MKTHRRQKFHVRPGQDRQKMRAGFTLLELLLTSLLSAVLLAGLWSLFNTYMRLFETGQSKTEQSQLVRALAQQLAEDLHGIAAAPPPAPAQTGSHAGPVTGSQSLFASPPAESGTALMTSASPSADPLTVMNRLTRNSNGAELPKFGLVGTSHVLKMEIIQPLTPDESTAEHEDSEELENGMRTPTVPELRTILYSYEEPREERETDRKAPPGLVRVELDWRAFAEGSQQSRRTRGETAAAGAESRLQETVERIGLTSSDGLASLPAGSSMYVPEVTHCTFRYFDGRDWLDEWDSLARKSLPAAVEVTLLLSPPPERWKPRARQPVDGTSSELVQPNQKRQESETDASGTLTETHRPYYRQVIALPSAHRDAAATTPGQQQGSFTSRIGVTSTQRSGNR